MSIKYYPETSLSTPCNPVDFDKVNKNELETLYSSMRDHMIEYQGIGIAANQIGEKHKACVLYSEAFIDRFLLLINPTIIRTGKDNIQFKEGCLSFPGIQINKQRHKIVTVSYQDIDGNSKEIVLKGVDAVCAQHEIDHLNGITFIDNLEDAEKEQIRLSVQKNIK